MIRDKNHLFFFFLNIETNLVFITRNLKPATRFPPIVGSIHRTKKTAGIHLPTIPCGPNSANRHKESHIFCEFRPCVVISVFRVFVRKELLVNRSPYFSVGRPEPLSTSYMVGRENKRTNNRTMFLILKNNAAAGYKGPAKIELLRGVGPLFWERWINRP